MESSYQGFGRMIRVDQKIVAGVGDLRFRRSPVR